MPGSVGRRARPPGLPVAAAATTATAAFAAAAGFAPTTAAAATAATRVAAATAATASVPTSAAPGPAGARGPLTRLAHADGSALEGPPVERFDDCRRIVRRAHLDERETARAPGVSVHDHLHLCDAPPALGKDFAELWLGHVVRQIPYTKPRSYLRSPCFTVGGARGTWVAGQIGSTEGTCAGAGACWDALAARPSAPPPSKRTRGPPASQRDGGTSATRWLLGAAHRRHEH